MNKNLINHRHIAALIALPILSACNGGVIVSKQATADTSSVDLRSSYTSYAALAHLQAEARSADGARATTRAYDMHQAATGLDGIEEAYGNSSAEYDCSISGVTNTQYNIAAEVPTKGDTLVVSEIACTHPSYSAGGVTQAVSNSVENWEIISGSINGYEEVNLEIQQLSETTEQSLTSGEVQQNLALHFTLRRDADSRYFKISDSTLSHSLLGETTIRHFEETVSDDVCERNYDLSFSLSPTLQTLTGMGSYQLTTLTPTKEVHIETDDGDSYVRLSEGKVRLSMSNGALIEYAAAGDNKVTVTLDQDGDGALEAQETLDYDTFLDRAYQNEQLASLSAKL